MKSIAFISLLLVSVTLACRTHKAPGPSDGSSVRIDFDNAICHIFTPDAERAVLLNASYHESSLTIISPPNLTLEQLKTAFGSTVSVDCNTGPCKVSHLDGLTLRIVHEDGETMKPSPLSHSGPGFDSYVPHLRNDANVTSLDGEIIGDFPISNFRTFFRYTGGTLSATKCKKKLKVKYKNSKTKDVYAADMVTLNGTTPTLAILEIRDSSELRTLKFQSKDVRLIIDNAPDKFHEKDPHFHLHKKVGNSPDFPLVVDAPECYPGRGVTVACGNTQWP